MRTELIGALGVPDGKKVSTLEWMRIAVAKLSGTGMVAALDRPSFVLGLGTGAVGCSAVAPVKLAELPRLRVAASRLATASTRRRSVLFEDLDAGDHSR